MEVNQTFTTMGFYSKYEVTGRFLPAFTSYFVLVLVLIVFSIPRGRELVVPLGPLARVLL